MKYLLLLLLMSCSEEVKIPFSLDLTQRLCTNIAKDLKVEMAILEDFKHNEILYTCNLVSKDGNTQRFINASQLSSVWQIIQFKNNLPKRPNFIKCCNKLNCYDQSTSLDQRVFKMDKCSKETGYPWDE